MKRNRIIKFTLPLLLLFFATGLYAPAKAADKVVGTDQDVLVFFGGQYAFDNLSDAIEQQKIPVKLIHVKTIDEFKRANFKDYVKAKNKNKNFLVLLEIDIDDITNYSGERLIQESKKMVQELGDPPCTSIGAIVIDSKNEKAETDALLTIINHSISGMEHISTGHLQKFFNMFVATSSELDSGIVLNEKVIFIPNNNQDQKTITDVVVGLMRKAKTIAKTEKAIGTLGNSKDSPSYLKAIASSPVTGIWSIYSDGLSTIRREKVSWKGATAIGKMLVATGLIAGIILFFDYLLFGGKLYGYLQKSLKKWLSAQEKHQVIKEEVAPIEIVNDGSSDSTLQNQTDPNNTNSNNASWGVKEWGLLLVVIMLLVLGGGYWYFRIRKEEEEN